MSTIGERLTELRKSQGLNRPQLARKADVSYSFIVQVESGQRENPRTDKLGQVAKALGVSLDDLLATNTPLPKAVNEQVADLRRELAGRLNKMDEAELRRVMAVLDELFGGTHPTKTPDVSWSSSQSG